jgi:hypothetical protein
MPLSETVPLRDRMKESLPFSLETLLQLRDITIEPAIKIFTRKSISLSSGAVREDGQKHETEYQKAGEAAYSGLFDYVRDSLFVEPRIVKLVNLRDKLLQNMAREGVTDVKASTT